MSDKHVTLKRIAVFCGANAGNKPEYIQSAKDLGAELARRKIGLVYGGMSQYSPAWTSNLPVLIMNLPCRRQCGHDGSCCARGIDSTLYLLEVRPAYCILSESQCVCLCVAGSNTGHS